jgi:hypothetical protein
MARKRRRARRRVPEITRELVETVASGERAMQGWDRWLASPMGASCADFSSLRGGDFLKNRLWHAYQAGFAAARDE